MTFGGLVFSSQHCQAETSHNLWLGQEVAAEPGQPLTDLCVSWCVPAAATVWRKPCRIFCKRTAACASWCASWALPGSRTPSRNICSWTTSSSAHRSVTVYASAVPSKWSRTWCTGCTGTSLPPRRAGPSAWAVSARPHRSSDSRSRCGPWRRCPTATTGIRRWATDRWGEETAAGCWWSTPWWGCTPPGSGPPVGGWQAAAGPGRCAAWRSLREEGPTHSEWSVIRERTTRSETRKS